MILKNGVMIPKWIDLNWDSKSVPMDVMTPLIPLVCSPNSMGEAYHAQLLQIAWICSPAKFAYGEQGVRASTNAWQTTSGGWPNNVVHFHHFWAYPKGLWYLFRVKTQPVIVCQDFQRVPVQPLNHHGSLRLLKTHFWPLDAVYLAPSPHKSQQKCSGGPGSDVGFPAFWSRFAMVTKEGIGDTNMVILHQTKNQAHNESWPVGSTGPSTRWAEIWFEQELWFK